MYNQFMHFNLLINHWRGRRSGAERRARQRRLEEGILGGKGIGCGVVCVEGPGVWRCGGQNFFEECVVLKFMLCVMTRGGGGGVESVSVVWRI